jgi:hypothetical protein
MGWAGHASRKGKKRNIYKSLVRKPEGSDKFQNIGIDGWIIINGS